MTELQSWGVGLFMGLMLGILIGIGPLVLR
jgi:hypothetical protein